MSSQPLLRAHQAPTAGITENKLRNFSQIFLAVAQTEKVGLELFSDWGWRHQGGILSSVVVVVVVLVVGYWQLSISVWSHQLNNHNSTFIDSQTQ